MGEPAEPTPDERKDTWVFAEAVVESVRNDDHPPLGWNDFTMVFALADEVLRLRRALRVAEVGPCRCNPATAANGCCINCGGLVSG